MYSKSEEYLNMLNIWAIERGYSVAFINDGDDAICYLSKMIEINASLPKEIQIIRLLHECGHVLIYENGSFFDFKSLRTVSKESTKYRVYTVVEEIEAWKRGEKLAKRLGMDIDSELLEKSKVSALKKYIDWAAKKENNDEY